MNKKIDKTLEIGCTVESVDSHLDWKLGGERIFGTVRAFHTDSFGGQGGLIEVYWPATKKTTFHYDGLYFVSPPKKKKSQK